MRDQEKHLRLNKIVTDPVPKECEFDSYWECVSKENNQGKKISLWNNDLRHILPALIQESAHEIIIPSFGYSTDWDQVITHIDKLPEIMKRRIRLVDKKMKIWKQSKTFFNPVINELEQNFDFLFAPERDVFETKALAFTDYLNILVRSFYFLILASKEKAEADIGIERIKHAISVIKKPLQNDEALFRLNQFQGLLNLYERTDLASIQCVPTTLSLSIEERLNTLLEETEMIQMSQQKNLLGQLQVKPQLIIKKIRKYVEKIIKKQKYRNLVGVSNQFVNVFRGIGYPLPEIPKIFESKYNPVLVDLKPLRMKTNVAKNPS